MEDRWLWGIVIAGVITLIGIVYTFQTGRIKHVEEFREAMPKPADVLTEARHTIICKDNMKELKENYLELKFENIHTALSNYSKDIAILMRKFDELKDYIKNGHD